MNSNRAQPTTISVILVNYNTPELTLACINSIYTNPPIGEFEVIVVDNDSHDDSVNQIATNFPECVLIESKENLGFSGGNNLALKQAKHDILLLLNSDTEVHEHTFAKLQSFLSEHPAAAVVSGKHYKTDGSVQRTIKYFPTIRNKWAEAFFLHSLLNGKSFSEHETRLSHYDTAKKAEWLSGSYLAVRRKWYDLVGGLDDGFFMYAEDTDWCYRIHKAGGELWYVPESIITHHCGGSSSMTNNLSVELVRSRDRYARIHMGKTRACLYRMGTTFELLIRLTIFGILSIFSRQARLYAKQRFNSLIALHNDPLPK